MERTARELGRLDRGLEITFLLAGAWILFCIPAIYVAEALRWPQWPWHTTQFVATLACFTAAATYLLRTGKDASDLRGVAKAAVILTGAWLGFIGIVLYLLRDGIAPF